MIIKDYDQIQLSCDQCGSESLVYDEGDFEQMISECRAAGWKITRPEGQWQHTCNDCASGGGALAAARRKFGIK